jgi:biotin carboxyl carrier protein
MTFEIEIGGRAHVVSVEPLGVPDATGGRFRLTVHPLPAGEGPAWTVDVDARLTDLGFSLVSVPDGRVFDAAVTDRAGGACLVQLPHVDLEAIVDGRRRQDDRAGGPAGSGEHRVTAPMPGRVLRVLVQPGDAVTVRQGLVVVEAMKMENELTAPRDGRVRDVHVAAGASVEAGRVLVVLE